MSDAPRLYASNALAIDTVGRRSVSAKRSMGNALAMYAFLWLIEGGLRRWLLPQFSDALLIIRDPLAIYIYALAIRHRLFVFGPLEIAACIVATLAFVATFLVGHQNFFVALFGVRTLILHLPLIFIIGRAVDIRYVQWIIKWILIVLLPMTVLLVVQFSAPQTAFVNIGLGGEGSAGFSGALDKFRPPGTFSFITGPICFYPLATAAIFAALLRMRTSLLWLSVSGGCVLIACPISISRTLVLSVAIVGVTGAIAFFKSRRASMGLGLKTVSIVILAILMVGRLPVLQESLAAFGQRWQASTTENGGIESAIVDRALSGMTEPVAQALDEPLFGRGLGLGTNVGARLLVGQAQFLAGENEWERLISEMGPLLGVVYICLRLLLFFQLFRFALSRWRQRNPIPMLFLSACAFQVIQGQWGQSTILGFSIFCSGLVIASGRTEGSPAKVST